MKVLIVNPSVYVEGKPVPEGEFDCDDKTAEKLKERGLALEVSTPERKKPGPKPKQK